MEFRHTKGILTDSSTSDPVLDADFIVSAMVTGFAIQRLQSNCDVQFDIAPKEAGDDDAKWQRQLDQLDKVAQAIGDAAKTFLGVQTGNPNVRAGTAVDHRQGAVIVGIYGIAGHERPTTGDIQDPTDALSVGGKVLFDLIKTKDEDPSYQYVGRGAYTGFVDDIGTQEGAHPIGPLSSVRTAIPGNTAAHGTITGWFPRWLPRADDDIWGPRLRYGKSIQEPDSHIGWGIIGGNTAGREPDDRPNPLNATNHADQTSSIMHVLQGMDFLDEGDDVGICGYTHGMIRAIYSAYEHGPSCIPYEITVGHDTTKLSSCLGCSVFMTATGYTPSSIHLGSAESWSPFYGNLSDPYGRYEPAIDLNVMRDLNQRFARYCDNAIRLGLAALPVSRISEQYHASRKGLHDMLGAEFSNDRHVASALFLDALTVHGKDVDRLGRVYAMG